MCKKILCVLLAIWVSGCTSVGDSRTVYNNDIEADQSISVDAEYSGNTLRIATLNLAHGRKDSFSQFFLSHATIKKNLKDIADVLNRYKPQVVAFQEADSLETFHHVQYLASQAQYPWRAHASNMDFWNFSYGTALMSVLPFTQSIEHTFAPSPPTFNKGFVLAQLEWPSSDNKVIRKVDVISVHLDFSRQSVREQQIKEMIDVLSSRKNPTIIMGDFNSEWLKGETAIKKLLTTTRFMTYKPESSGYNTYGNKRLDWVLITSELEFVDYRVLPDILSDHQMVITEIRFKSQQPIYGGL
jgi:endonuclease/exonuclease/phosphatase family metal-dependent hydrolase